MPNALIGELRLFYFMELFCHKIIMAVFIYRINLIIYFLFFTVILFAKPMQDFYNVKIISVYDGDTFKVCLPCQLSIFCDDISVRVKNIDTPELKTKDKCERVAAKRAKKLTKEFLSGGNIILKNCERDKYFRLLCEVKKEIILTKEESDLSLLLLKNNLAYQYCGKTKQEINWCINFK